MKRTEFLNNEILSQIFINSKFDYKVTITYAAN